MPTNLNALIRYKQIDACLRNQFVRCTVERLQDVCSEAMGEHRGIYKQVSERTIREDIRVMRSNILGFNAPIEYKDGAFHYSDNNYSIFSTPVTEVNLLRDILKMLLEERNNIADAEVDKLLKRISVIVGEPLPFEEDKEEKLEFIPPPKERKKSVHISESREEPDLFDDDSILLNQYSLPPEKYDDFEEEDEARKNNSSISRIAFSSLFRKEPPKKMFMLWDEILKVI